MLNSCIRTVTRTGSSREGYNLDVVIWRPVKEKVKGVIQVVPCVSESSGRYNSFAEFFTEKGYVVVCSDLVVEEGFSISNIGWDALSANVAITYNNVISYKYNDLPVYLFGYSFGTYIIRSLSASKDENYSGRILVGVGSCSTLRASLDILRLKAKNLLSMGSLRDSDAKSLVIGRYNRRFDEGRCAWLFKSDAKRIDYLTDPFVVKSFSVKQLLNMLDFVKCVNQKEKIEYSMSGLKTLLISGSLDVMSNLNSVEKRLCKYCDVEKKVLEGYRHDVLHDDSKLGVYKLIADFIGGIESGEEGSNC